MLACSRRQVTLDSCSCTAYMGVSST